MSIVITSGVVKGAEEIESLVNTAIDTAFFDALTEICTFDIGLFNITVARRRDPIGGRMRKAVAQGMRKVLRGLPFHGGKTFFSWDTFKAAVISFVKYAKYHFRGRGFYVNPSTPSTFPMRLSRMKPIAEAAFIKHRSIQLKLFGIEETQVTGGFS